MEANVQKQAGSKPVIKTAYPVNEKAPKPRKTGAYVTEGEGDFAIGRPVPAGRYAPGFELPPVPYPGPGKVKPSRYVPGKQGSEFDLSELRKYLEDIMGDTVYIMIPMSKKDLAKYGRG